MGKAGAISVEVNRQCNGGWSLSIEAPEWCLAFDVAGPGSVAKLAEFLREHAGRAEYAEFAVGSLAGMAVRVVHDDESGDRLFLRAAGGGALVDFTLTGEIAGQF